MQVKLQVATLQRIKTSLKSFLRILQYHLAGASGGVYALVSAHLASLILNWEEDSLILRRRIRSGRFLNYDRKI
jgi:hypothetical protein